MRLITARFIAILLLVIPGFMATYGFLEMKNALFDYFAGLGEEHTVSFAWLQMLTGVTLFVLGVGFVGGWIFFRDRKRNYVAPRFKKKTSD